MENNENEMFLKEDESNKVFSDNENEGVSSLTAVVEMISEAGDLLELTAPHDSNKVIESSDKYAENGTPKCEVSAYMAERMMTPLQEKVNAWTVVPNVIYCTYFLLAGKWLSEQAIELARLDMMSYLHMQEGDFTQWAREVNASDRFSLFNLFGLEGKCISNSFFPNLHAVPPLPLLAIVLGVFIHAPFSILYHYNCATILPSDVTRIEHWSRRMDHSMIHVGSAFLSYGAAGRWEYFIINAIYNLDCVYRQFKPKVDPKSNKRRILISVVSYTIPVLINGNFTIFFKLWGIIVLSGWLFAKYPIRGWSHSVFHIVFSVLPHLLLIFACTLPSSQFQIDTAARCAVFNSQ